MGAIGALSEREARTLARHLGRCPECAAEASKLAETAGLLNRASLDHLVAADATGDARFTSGAIGTPEPVATVTEVSASRGPTTAPATGPARGQRVGAVRRGADRPVGDRVRRTFVGVGAVLAAVAAALSVTTAAGSGVGAGVASGPVRGGSTAIGTDVALTGEAGVTATARLEARTWGTKVVLSESGEPGGQVLTVSMKTSSGRWWVAGSYQTGAEGGAVRVELTCAVPPRAITDVWVTDQSGRTVLNGVAPEA